MCAIVVKNEVWEGIQKNLLDVRRVYSPTIPLHLLNISLGLRHSCLIHFTRGFILKGELHHTQFP
jgi:hypothetical protein